MLCEPYKEALIEAAAMGQGAGELAPALRRHIDVCADCRSFLQAQCKLQSAIAERLALRVADVPAELVVRVRSGMAERKTPSRILQWTALATAMVVVLVFIMQGGLRRSVGRSAIGQVAAAVPSIPGSGSVESKRAVRRTRVSREASPEASRILDAEFRPLVSSEQREIVEHLVRGVQRGEIKGEVLRWEAQVSETKEVQIAPKQLEALEVAAEGSAPDAGVSGSPTVTDRRSE
jgi:hypothetical protein